MLLVAVTDRPFANGGHALDFINKAFECVELIGQEHAAAILPTVVGQLVAARGADEDNAWRHPVDLVPLMAQASGAIAAALAAGRARGGSFAGHSALAEALLGDEPGAIAAALLAALEQGALPHDLGRALAYAAALRIARFGTANEFADWDTARCTASPMPTPCTGSSGASADRRRRVRSCCAACCTAPWRSGSAAT